MSTPINPADVRPGDEIRISHNDKGIRFSAQFIAGEVTGNHIIPATRNAAYDVRMWSEIELLNRPEPARPDEPAELLTVAQSGGRRFVRYTTQDDVMMPWLELDMPLTGNPAWILKTLDWPEICQLGPVTIEDLHADCVQKIEAAKEKYRHKRTAGLEVKVRKLKKKRREDLKTYRHNMELMGRKWQEIMDREKAAALPRQIGPNDPEPPLNSVVVSLTGAICAHRWLRGWVRAGWSDMEARSWDELFTGLPVNEWLLVYEGTPGGDAE